MRQSLLSAAKERSIREAMDSVERVDADRRRYLYDVAGQSYKALILQVLSAFASEFPRSIQERRISRWQVRLGKATLELHDPRYSEKRLWAGDEHTALDVIAFGRIRVSTSSAVRLIVPRSHALWFSNLDAPDTYGWDELAFNGFMELVSDRPFSLPPGEKSAAALARRGMEYSLAESHLRIDRNLEDFISRWAVWFVAAYRSSP